MENRKPFEIKVQSLRTINSPYKKKEDGAHNLETTYYALVNMRDLPEKLPLDVNPREPKMTTNVARALLSVVEEPETDFHINNRGIVISAKEVSFNSQSSTLKMDLGNQDSEEEKMLYGILDGGHTYRAIISRRANIPKDIDKYVRLEIITNVQNITRLSDARNTSVQVSDIALFNLDDKFNLIKEVIENESYARDIAYKDNEENKRINVSELLRLMYTFDIDKFPGDSSAPVQAYSGKAQVFKRYKAACDGKIYRELTKNIPTLVELFNTIERGIPSKYDAYKQNKGIKKPRFGAVKGVESFEGRKVKAQGSFSNTDLSHKISTGYIYPIFGAFRALLKFDEEKGILNWLFDPLEIWEEIGERLVQTTFETHNNPNVAGKDTELWLSNYRTVETQSLRKLLTKK